MNVIASFPTGKALSLGLTLLAALALAPIKVQADCTPPPAGQVAWWSAEGNANDLIGTNHGTPIGALGYTNGWDGQAFVFDGSTSYIPVPASSSLNIGTNNGFTIECWIKPNAYMVTAVAPIIEWDSATTDGLQLWTGNLLSANLKDTSGVSHKVELFYTFDTNKFYHVAVTYDKSSGLAVLYINGTNVAASNFGSLTPQTTYPVNIGRRTGQPIGLNNTYGGLLDELSLYSRALSQSEIQAIYNAGSAGKCVPSAPACVTPPAGLISWWPAGGNGNDVIGGNNAIVPPNGITFSNAEVGLGFNFNGSTNQLLAPDAPGLNFGSNQNFSIEAWIMPQPAPGNSPPDEMTIAYKRYAPNAYQYIGYAFYLANNGQLFFLMGDQPLSVGGVIVSAGPDLRDGNFHHVAVTVQRNSTNGGHLYVDGTNALTFDPSAHRGSLSNSEPFIIGGQSTPGYSTPFKGVIDELSLYNRALAASNISAIYNAGSAGKCSATSPVITAHPASQTVFVGATASFTVAASGTSPLSFRWRVNGTNIGGATNSTLTLSNVQVNLAGNYSVLVTNLYGTATSSNAMLTVNSVTPACTPPPSDIVAWLPAAGNAQGLIGTNNGVLAGGMAFSNGVVGQTFAFNHTNAHVMIPASPSLDVGNSSGFTLEAWIKPKNVTEAQALFEWNDLNYWGVHFQIAPGQPFNVNPGPGELYANIPDTGGFWHQLSSPGGVLVSNVFQHVALTYDKSSGLATIYCNGAVVGQQNIGSFTPLTSYSLYLGRRPAPSGELTGYAGLMDEPSVYSRALAQSEIQNIYNAGSAGKCTSVVPATNSVGIPVITLVAPLAGTNGAVITLSGTNFSATASSNIVHFGAVRANVSAASPTSLTVTVPAGATYAPITVTVNGFVAYANSPFLPTFTGNGAAIDNSAFAAGFNLPAADGPYRVVMADLDGDGRPDLVVEAYYAGTVSIYQNLGTNGVLNAGTFAAPVVFSIANNSAPLGLTVADVNGDGKLDVLATDDNNNQIAVIQNLSGGGLLTTNSFAAPVYFPVSSSPFTVVVRDLDGDGHADISSVNSGGTISILRGTGAAGPITSNSFAARVDLVAANGQDLAVGDLDGDGKPDLAMADTTGFISVFRNNCTPGNISTNSFASRVNLPAQSGAAYVVMGDLDGDGKPELISTAYLPQTLSVFRNLSSPGTLTTNSFAAPADYSLAGRGHSLALADLNGDGKLDISVVTELSDSLAIFQNVGTGSFTSASLATRVDFAAGYNAHGVAVGDLNGDGRPDIAFGNQYGGTVTVYKNALPFGAPSTCTTPISGMVAWWPGEGNANDVISSNNGALFGGATYATGEVGQGFRFDGTNGYLQIPDSAALKPANLTVEAWVWLDPNVTGARNEQVIFKKNTWSFLFEGYSLLKEDVDNGNGTYTSRFSFVVTSGGNQIITRSTAAIQRGVWYHVAATYDGITQKLFVNGVLEASAFAGFALDYDTQPVFVGSTGIPGNYVNYLAGIIDEPSLYNRALATNEIAAIFNAGSAGKCGAPVVTCTPAPASLVAWLRAEGNLNDSAGTNHGTQSGGIAYSSGEAGQGFYFNGSSQIKLSASPGLNVGTSGGLTLETWIRPGHLTLFEPQFVFEWNDGAGNGGAQFLLSTDHGIYGDGFGNLLVNLVDTLGNSHALWTATNVIVTNALSHVALTYDKTSGLAVIYVNGLAAANTNLGSFTPQTSYDFYLGNRVSGPFAGSFFNGQLDEPSIYNRALSALEIQSIYNAGSAGKCVDSLSSVAVTLLDVDFGSGTNNGKAGFAAAGMTTNDFWNFYTRDDGVGGWRTFGSLVNLKNADGSETAAGLTVNNAPGSWGSTSTDPMYAGYIYPFDGGNVTVTLTNLPAGTYDVLPYSPNGNFDVAVGATSYGTRTCIENPVVNPPVWQEGVQYVRFTNVVVNAGQPLVLTVHPGVGDSALISGLQLALSSLTNALPPPPAAPFITSQPTNVTLLAGNPAAFSVTAQGSGPLTYQWRFNGTNLGGATGATLTLSNVQLALAGNYSVLVSNVVGTATSSNAVLNVLSPPVILSQTPSQVVLLGNPATFAVNAVGTGPLRYFWHRNNVLLPGETNFAYTIPSAQFVDSGKKFSCVISNAYGLAATTNASLKVINTISNDLCSGAVLITSSSYTNVQTTAPASSYGDPLPDCVDGFGNGVWYQFTPPVGGRLVVDTDGSDFDTGLAIYTGDCDALTQVDCNDDTDGVTSALTIPTTGGVTYKFLIGGYNAHVGNLVFHLHHFTPPAFDVQPTNIAVIVSSNGQFGATLSGTLPISLQWYFNDLPLADGGRISGVTNATLNLVGVITNDGGNYYLVASNFVGVKTSSVAVLTPIILPPFFLVQPSSQSILTGSNVNFSAVVDGTPPYYFQWNFNGSPLVDDGVHISGSATTSLNISNLTTADAGSYSLFVTNVVGATNSDLAVLTVLVPPSITLNPVGRSVPPGLPTTINASASGIPAPAYQWQLNGTNLPGATSASYLIPAVGTNQLGFYHLIASNSVGVATSTDAQLTFGPVAAWGRNINNESLPPPNLSNVLAVAGTYAASYAVRTDGSITAWGTGNATNVPASATNVVVVAASGTSGTYALRADGRVVGWNGILPPGLSNIVAVAAGNNFGYALRAEGTLTNWGTVPTPPFSATLNQITAIACGYNNALALRSDGTIAVSGTSAVTNVPVSVTNVVAIAAGYTYAMALRADGKVIVWGNTTISNLTASLTNIVAISAGNYLGENYGLAIRASGKNVAFGDNGFGESTPPAALSNLVSIAGAAAPFHGLALVNDGGPVILHPPIGLTAYTGRDVTLRGDAVGAAPLNYQWLLNGTNVPGATGTSLIISNVQLTHAGNYQLFVSNSISTAISLPAPLTVISNNTLFLLSQTTASPTNLYQGGKGTLGGLTVLGNGPLRYQWFFSPTNKNYTAVPAATNDTLVLDPALVIHTGNYYVAVSNQFAGLTNPPVFLRVQFAKAWGYLATDPPTNLVVSNATAIAVGNSGQGSSVGHYLVLKSDGKISSWTPATSTAGETNFASVSNAIITAIAAGYQDSLVLKSDGTVAAFGYNLYGETNVPAGLNGVTAIACGDYHDLALKSDGSLVGWGQTTYLQTSNSAATNVVAIAAGGQNSMVLRANGSVFGWGFSNTQIPSNVTNVIAIACGSQHFLALRANGTVVGWGINTYGQTTLSTNLTNIVAIAAGANHSTLLRNDGTVVTLGAYNGQTTITAPADLANVVAIASSADHDLALFGTRAPAFTVQPWNRAVALSSGIPTNISLTAKCAGVQPVSYQWRRNGTNVVGATNDVLAMSFNGQANTQIIPGTYQLVASNSYGVTISKAAKVTLVIPLAVALDTVNGNGSALYNWLTSGSAPWFGQTNITHDGVDAARSGGIGALQESILQTTLGTNLAGSVTFWWKVSSEQFFDTLEFRINGTVQATLSGEVDWQQASFPVAAGTNLLQWRYSKDVSFDEGLDAGFVDQFAFASAPVINLQPSSVVANLGQSVSLQVVATGTPQLGYQWQQNGSPVGGNSSLLTLSGVARAQAGTYSVIVTNSGGMAVSSNAVVVVKVPQLLGTPVLLPDGSLQLISTDANGGLLQPADLANFEAQGSTNLVNWTTLPGALSLTNGMLQLQDAARTNFTTRYYRILEH